MIIDEEENYKLSGKNKADHNSINNYTNTVKKNLKSTNGILIQYKIGPDLEKQWKIIL